MFNQLLSDYERRMVHFERIYDQTGCLKALSMFERYAGLALSVQRAIEFTSKED